VALIGTLIATVFSEFVRDGRHRRVSTAKSDRDDDDSEEGIMSSLKDRRNARRLATPRITQVRMDVSDSQGQRKSFVWSGLNLPRFQIEGNTLFVSGRIVKRVLASD
jgi:hypothetical protein